MDFGGYIFLGAIALVVVYGVVVYNNLVKFKNRGENAFSQIDVQLKRRYDLIPNLVETAKGYLAHERETLEAVTQARNNAQDALGKMGGDLFDAQAVQNLARPPKPRSAARSPACKSPSRPTPISKPAPT